MVLPIDKWLRLLKTISANGGPIRSLIKLWKHDTLKLGEFRGTDSYGNKYYESNYYMIGRSRWVEFNPKINWEYDASQVTAQWHGWLHYKTDQVPCEDPAMLHLYRCCWTHCWLQPHKENLSGTKLAYYPYSTVQPHMNSWDGATVCDRKNRKT